VLGGVGVAGLLAGGALGIVAAIDHGSATNDCIAGGGGVVCDSSGYARTRDAQHLATGSTVALIAGGALTVAGVVLFLSDPGRRSPGTAWTLSPLVGEREGGVGLRGSW
jgi:hypothetical protein